MSGLALDSRHLVGRTEEAVLFSFLRLSGSGDEKKWLSACEMASDLNCFKGRLYPILRRLRRKKLIRVRSECLGKRGSREMKTFQITEYGLAMLKCVNDHNASIRYGTNLNGSDQ